MPRTVHTRVFFLLFVILTLSAAAQKKRHKATGNGWRFNLGTSLNNYTTNDKHGVDPKQKMNATFGIRRELRIVRDYKTFLLVGAEYLFHGVNYRSYYFRPDSFKIYDRKYPYTYSLNMNELHLPIEVKYLMRRMDNSLYSPYFLFGYHIRYLLPASLRVTKDGELIQTDRPDMHFRHPLLSSKINSSLCLALGWQLNRLGNSHRSFFAELSGQYGFSDYSFQAPYSATNMYLNCIQVTFNVGAKL